jgi:hypothetical protein
MGVSVQLLQIERKNCHCKPPTTPQYLSLMFVITFKDFTNNYYICWDKLSCLATIATKHNNSSQQQIEKHSWMQSWERHMTGTYGLRFKVYDKKWNPKWMKVLDWKKLNGWKFWIKIYLTQVRMTSLNIKVSIGYWFLINTLPIWYLQKNHNTKHI